MDPTTDHSTSPSLAGAQIAAVSSADVIKQVVDVHMRAFPQFFMTKLGSAFVRQYYRAVLEFPAGIMLVAQIEGTVAGFAAGFGDPARFYSFYRRRRLRMAMPILVAILKSPSLTTEIFNSYRRISATQGQTSVVELSSLAVAPSHTSSGIGRGLAHAFADVARARGYRAVCLTTDAAGNDRVNSFYAKCGFVLERQWQRGPRLMNKLRLQL